MWLLTRFHVTSYGAEDGNLVNFEAFDRSGTVLAPKQCLYTKVAMGMENLKCKSRGFIYRRMGPNMEITVNFEAFDHSGTVFAPKQGIY